MNAAPGATVPLVSVVMPLHNAGRFVDASVASVLGQTHPILELVVVDDGSTDGSAERVAALADPRVRLVRQERQGVAAALNRGIREARGDWIARMDADDLCAPDRIERQMRFLAAHPEVRLVGTGCAWIDAAGRERARTEVPTDHESIVAALAERNPMVHASVVVDRRALASVGPYDPSYPTCEDYELWLRFARKHRMANLPEPLYSWRILPGSESRRDRGEQILRMGRARRRHGYGDPTSPSNGFFARRRFRARVAHAIVNERIPAGDLAAVRRRAFEAWWNHPTRGGYARSALYWCVREPLGRLCDAIAPRRPRAARPARVLHVLHELSRTGAPRVALHLAGRLDRTRFLSEGIALRDGPLRAHFEGAGIPCDVMAIGAGGWTRRDVLRMSERIRRGGYDLVHAHTIPGSIGVLAAWLAGVPSVWQVHESPVRYRIHRARLALRCAGCLVAVSEAVRRPLARLARRPVRTIPNGISLRAGGTEHRDGSGARLLAAGNLAPHKGFDILLRALARVRLCRPDARLTVLGDPVPGREGYARRLWETAAALGLGDAVAFRGTVDDIRPSLREADLFVSASRTEGFGLAVLEAMAAGTPVVASAAGGIPELIRDGIDGQLVPVGSPERLATAILYALGNPEARRTYAARARGRAAARFDDARMAAAFEGIYAELLGETA